MDRSLIQIFRGDDTDGLGYQSIKGKITTTLDLDGCTAIFRFLGFTQTFNPIPSTGNIVVTIPAEITARFPPGLGYASLRVFDSRGKVRTFTNRIPVFVSVSAPSECGGEFEVIFNVGTPDLEPLKIWSSTGWKEYNGYVTQLIDKATATEYGLALLYDGFDSESDANGGTAATPKAVKAAYDAVIQELTDNYYTRQETDDAIDSLAAYYITKDAQGNPFDTRAQLNAATIFYSGGTVRVPTRNDYCVVLEDETHDGQEWRYICAVSAQGVKSWEPQYPVGGTMTIDTSVTKNSPNPVTSGGIWSAIWGALSALPTGFSSLYDWCVNQLAGKYEKPSTGIPKTDLSAGVQESLGKADTALQNSGEQTIYGFAGSGVKLVFGFDSNWPWIRFHYSDGSYAIVYGPLSNGTIALLSDIYAAIRQIAPAFSAKAYVLNELCTYSGVVYRCKSAYTATASSAKPPNDTTHWEAKKVSELFLPLTGGTMTGPIAFANDLYELPNPPMRSLLYAHDSWEFVDHMGNIISTQPYASGVIALLSNTMRFFTAVSYNVGDVVFYNGAFYRCTTAHTAGAWNASHFTEVIGGLSTGTPTAPTPTSGDNSTNVATTAFVQGEVAGVPLRYDMPAAVALVAENDAATLVCADRAVTNATIATGFSTLNLTFPAAISGKVRDFYLRITVAAGESAPALSIPQGITIENPDGAVPEIADGETDAASTTLVWFSETAPNVFTAKSETVKAVA